MSDDDPREALKKRLAAQLEPGDYTFPGTDVPIKVRLLAEREVDFAKIEAQRFAKKLNADLEIDPDFLDREIQRQIVWRSTFEPIAKEGKLVPLFPSDAEVRDLDTVTVESLYQLYIEHQERRSVMRYLTQEQVDKLAAALRSAPQSMSYELSRYDHGALVRLIVSLINRPPSETDETPNP